MDPGSGLISVARWHKLECKRIVVKPADAWQSNRTAHESTPDHAGIAFHISDTGTAVFAANDSQRLLVGRSGPKFTLVRQASTRLFAKGPPHLRESPPHLPC